nr:MAG TPA: hypothetical protein [Caudoviricetes sp.]
MYLSTYLTYHKIMEMSIKRLTFCAHINIIKVRTKSEVMK